MYKKKGYLIPESGKAAKGTNIVNILQVETGERVQAMLHFRETGDDQLYLFMTTRNGTVKRLGVSALKNLRNNGIRALTLDEGDRLIDVLETHGSDRILIATHDGQAVCFDETDVRAMGRTAVGVRGIRLREGDYVVGAAKAQPGKTVLSITAGDGGRHPHPHGSGEHPGGRTGHPGRHRHALQGGGRPRHLHGPDGPGAGRRKGAEP